MTMMTILVPLAASLVWVWFLYQGDYSRPVRILFILSYAIILGGPIYLLSSMSRPVYLTGSALLCIGAAYHVVNSYTQSRQGNRDQADTDT